MRGAFTLIEMMVSVGLLAMMTLFLYQSVAALQRSNHAYADHVEAATHELLAVKTLVQDLALSLPESLVSVSDDPDRDQLFLQTSNSVHGRIMPYVAYRVVDANLYRIESSRPLGRQTRADEELVIDRIGAVERFKLFRNGRYVLIELKLRSRAPKLFKTGCFATVSQ